MNSLRLLLAELRFRKLNFAMSLLAVVIAVTLFVAGPMLVDAYRQETRAQLDGLQSDATALHDRISTSQRETAAELARLEKETRRIMRDLGFNLMIVHRDTNMSDFWASDFAAEDMPQEYVNRLAADPRLTLVTHLVATLQAKIAWENRKVLLVGYLPETPQAHAAEKKPMGQTIKPGTVVLGCELGVGRKAGETVRVLDRPFRIARCLPEQGSKEDISMAMNLQDAQTLLKRPGRINQIMALGCRCAGSSLADVRKQLEAVLPQTRITEFKSLASAREEQRALVEEKQTRIVGEMKRDLQEREKTLSDVAASRNSVEQRLEKLALVVPPVVVLAAAVWVGLLSLANVRERRTEIGLLRALGKGSGLIAWLFLGKAVLLGLLGGLIGLAAGIWLGEALGVWVLDVSSGHFALPMEIWLCALLGAPAVAALASYLPMLVALTQDPAVVLREG